MKLQTSVNTIIIFQFNFQTQHSKQHTQTWWHKFKTLSKAFTRNNDNQKNQNFMYDFFAKNDISVESASTNKIEVDY